MSCWQSSPAFFFGFQGQQAVWMGCIKESRFMDLVSTVTFA
jgi:hypothetical protein